MTNITTISTLIGKPKSAILDEFKQDDCVEFLHWLYVPKLKLLMSFHRQVCAGVEVV
ncbi:MULTISPECIES: hypothetical protein [Moraxella]|uniref:hypothetical protein n=1 Tax=Moraxella TaxID=475 RepID=UPI0012DF3C44|nr:MULTISPECIES: hypothetical protein [Moraxella]MBE9578859.1 hypothetical protein [Moraxella sp. K1664]MBE9589138.1 hypothetical protein [Moraxella sp. K1630]MBE9589882.1 hypothetical protein [Moraxella sp. K127]MBE9597382.1 hypothetical protein [Moraxella sp. K2450]MDH9218834.1 hypothetical protein [Moraxella lacunata]